MRRDTGTLVIEKIIVHDVPRRLLRMADDKAPRVEYSEIESLLTSDLRNYFTERIRTSFNNATLHVCFDPGCAEPVVAQAVHGCLCAVPTDFIERSKSIAKHLYDCQNGNNPGGLVVVAQCQISGQSALTILKLEKEQAIQLERQTNQGKQTFNLNHLKNLTLGDKTRVFKAGLFIGNGTDIADIEGIVSDKQQSTRQTAGIAEFFLTKFLGCRLREDPAVVTKRIYELSMGFFNDEVDDPQDKSDYQSALLVTLKNNDPDLNLQDLARLNMKVEHRDSFVRHLRDNGLAQTIVRKDTSLIGPQIRNARWEFSSGLKVTGPPTAFREHVEFEIDEDGQTRLQITDTTKKIR